jgi:hypothetical protein
MSRRPQPLLAGCFLAFGVGAALVLTGHGVLPDQSGPAPRIVPDFDLVGRAVIIPKDELPDAAIAVFDSLSPRIYLNTRLLAQIGPDLAAFLRAHEEGHLALHHVPERRFGLSRLEAPVPVLHGYEFAADCYAGQVLRRDYPASVRAALRFFQKRRDLVTDSAHPSMGARADRLIDCLTDPSQSFHHVSR